MTGCDHHQQQQRVAQHYEQRSDVHKIQREREREGMAHCLAVEIDRACEDRSATQKFQAVCTAVYFLTEAALGFAVVAGCEPRLSLPGSIHRVQVANRTFQSVRVMTRSIFGF
jgi:hypothetical protein